MRENPGVRHARCGELELRLDSLPPQPSVLVDHSPDVLDEDEEERRSLETLLHSTSVDPVAFAAAAKKLRAA